MNKTDLKVKRKLRRGWRKAKLRAAMLERRRNHSLDHKNLHNTSFLHTLSLDLELDKRSVFVLKDFLSFFFQQQKANTNTRKFRSNGALFCDNSFFPKMTRIQWALSFIIVIFVGIL